MSSFDYDGYGSGGDYVSWKNPGDQVVGTIKEIRDGLNYDQTVVVPELVLEINSDGDEVTLTAAQAMLISLLQEEKPQVGQKIRVTYTGDETTSRGGTKKLFTLEVKEGEGLIQAAVSNSEEPF